MPVALNTSETRDYVLECDRALPADQQTVFQLGFLDLATRIRIEDEQTDYQFSASKSSSAKADVKISRHGRNLKLVRLALCGWRTFRDDKGNEIEFETIAVPSSTRKGTANIVADSCLARFKMEWIDELADAILGTSELSETERKNSDTPSR